MAIELNSNHNIEALNKLLVQFFQSPKIQAWLTSYMTQIQEIEGTLIDSFEALDLETAADAQLDRIGSIVGEPRNGQTDDIYRLNIRARILINKSRGTPTDVLELISLLTGGSTGVTYGRGSTGGNYLIEINKVLPGSLDLDRLLYYVCQATQAAGSFYAAIGVSGGNTAQWDVNNWDDFGFLAGVAALVEECISPEDGGLVPAELADQVPPIATIDLPVDPPIFGSLGFGDADYTVTFSDDVALNLPTSLVAGQITVGGTAGGVVSAVLGTNPYTVTVDSFTSAGTTDITIDGVVVSDTSGNPNAPTTSATLNVIEQFEAFTDNDLTMNSIDYSPVIAYRGNDATTTSFPEFTGSGTTMTVSGSAPTVDIAGPVGGMELVDNATNSWFVANGAQTDLDFGMNDGFLAEFVFRKDGGTGNQFVMASNTSAANPGIIFRTTTRLICEIRDDSSNNTIQFNDTTNLTDTDYYYFLVGFDRSGNLYFYEGENGNEGTFAHTITDDITSTGSDLRLLGNNTAVEWQGEFAWFAIYNIGSVDISSGTIFDDAAEARYIQLGYSLGTPIS